MYAEDSFFTLSAAGQGGLALMSILLSAGTLLVAVRVMRGWPRFVRVGLALAVFILFVWLSPQLYYQYYRVIFDGLPQQIVVRVWPDLVDTARILTFTHRPTLSFHGQALLGWALILLSLRPKRPRPL